MFFLNDLNLSGKNHHVLGGELALLSYAKKGGSAIFPDGKIELLFSGGGNITLGVECIDVLLKDVSESFNSTTSRIPNHPITDPDND